MESPEHFEYASVAESAGISAGQLRDLERRFEADDPNDAMLRELHILRACIAVHEGRARIDGILKPDGIPA